jgi:hypothetical protein
MATKTMVRLRTHQRNLFNYMLKWKRKCPDLPCLVPVHTAFGVRQVDHIQAVNSLEKMQLISVNRASPHYTQWTMKPAMELSVIENQ